MIATFNIYMCSVQHKCGYRARYSYFRKSEYHQPSFLFFITLYTVFFHNTLYV